MTDRTKENDKIASHDLRPHFIFNMLNQIKCEAILQSGNEIGMIDDFSKYMRYVLEWSGSHEMVPIHKELDFVKTYMKLEQWRFPQIEMDVVIESQTYEKQKKKLEMAYSFLEETQEAEDGKIPPFLIKELVHNGIHHGVLKSQKPGRVVVRLQEEEGLYRIQVEDNGVGMGKDVLWEVMNREGTLQNIRQKCQEIGGQMLLHSKENEGTRVEICVKVRDKKDISHCDIMSDNPKCMGCREQGGLE